MDIPIYISWYVHALSVRIAQSVCVFPLHIYPSSMCASPPQSEDLTGRVVEDMEGASQANQRRMNADPLEVMLLNMGYRITGLSSAGAGASDDEDSSEGQVQCRPS